MFVCCCYSGLSLKRDVSSYWDPSCWIKVKLIKTHVDNYTWVLCWLCKYSQFDQLAQIQEHFRWETADPVVGQVSVDKRDKLRESSWFCVFLLTRSWKLLSSLSLMLKTKTFPNIWFFLRTAGVTLTCPSQHRAVLLERASSCCAHTHCN